MPSAVSAVLASYLSVSVPQYPDGFSWMRYALLRACDVISVLPIMRYTNQRSR